MASTWRIRRLYFPLQNSEFRITALNDKPVIRVIGDSPADFTSKFLKSSHAAHLVRQV